MDTITVTERDVRAAVKEINREYHFGMRVLRISEELNEGAPVYINQDVFGQRAGILIPRELDKSLVPAEADSRLELLREKFPIVAEYVGHPEPEFADENPEPERDWMESVNEAGPKVLAAIMAGVLAVAVIVLVLGVIAIAAAAALAIAVTVAALGGLFAAIDPNLVAVIRCAEGYAFVEAMKWQSEA